MTSILIDRTDGLSSAAAIKGPCRVATTANISLMGLQTIDGVSVVANDRVLVKDQDDASENGVYVADTGVWRRVKDFNRTKDVVTGTAVYVTSGDLGDGFYLVATTGVIVVGTTDITFIRAPAPANLSVEAFGFLTAETATLRTAALQAAIYRAASLQRSLYVPSNTIATAYEINDEIAIPDDFIGITDGMAGGTPLTAYFTMADGVDSGKCLFTNSNNNRQTTNAGNSNILIQGWGAIGNKNNRTGLNAAAIGPNTSGCGFGFAKVSNLFLIDCYADDNPLHGIDVNATVYGHGAADNIIDYGPTYGYTPNGDGTYPPGPSDGVYIIRPRVTGSGDDNLTIHGSTNVFIDNVKLTNPAGTYTENSNNIEIDDNCYGQIVVTGGHTMGGACGIQAKAHDDASAARDISIIGLTCEGAVQNFSFFHIGHRSTAQPTSLTAFNLKLTSCTSIRPVVNDDFIEPATVTDYPKALNISSYDGVDVVGFTAIGDPDNDDFLAFGTSTYNAAIFIGDKARNVRMTGTTIKDFPHMAYGLIVEEDCRGIVHIDKINVENSGYHRGVSLDTTVADVSLDKFYIVPPTVVSGTSYGLQAGATTRVAIGSGHIENGYTVNSRVNAIDSSGDVEFRQASGGFNWEGPGYFLNSLFAGNARADVYDQAVNEGMSYTDGETLAIARSAATPFYANRLTSEGQAIGVQYAGVTVGGIEAYADAARIRLGANQALFLTSYAGSPEGNVTANAGALVSDRTNGRFHLKGSGTGNTGWINLSQRRLIDALATGWSHTGNTTETTVLTLTGVVPANSLGPNGFLRVTQYWTCTVNDASVKTCRLKINGTEVDRASLANQRGTRKEFDLRNRGATNSQVSTPPAMQSSYNVTTAASPATYSFDTTAAMTITFTIENALSADNTKLEYYSIEAVYVP